MRLLKKFLATLMVIGQWAPLHLEKVLKLKTV
jgi:hypothetical protein